MIRHIRNLWSRTATTTTTTTTPTTHTHLTDTLPPGFRFEVLHQSSKSDARVGRITTPHGVIDTPNFVAVGTNGSLKIVDNVSMGQLLRESSLELQLMFCNTFHLMLYPGADVVQQAGGLHRFINRNAPIITDSGGFQVFSMMNNAHTANAQAAAAAASSSSTGGGGGGGGVQQRELKGQNHRKDLGTENLVKRVDEEGVLFKSYRCGATLLLTPEISVQVQKQLGADIIIPFDELLPMFGVTQEQVKRSLERTHRWELRSLEEHLKDPKQQAMYCVLHGSVDRDLRQESINVLCDQEQRFNGVAIGGSLGKDRDEMIDLLRFVMPRIPSDKPNHVLGIADLESVTRFLSLGVDTFDSAYPTRLGRHGNLFTSRIAPDDGKINPLDFDVVKIRSSKWRYVTDRPVDERCTCHTCRNYSIGYLHHLYKSHEPAFGTLGTIHNVHFLVNMMKQAREMILRDEI